MGRRRQKYELDTEGTPTAHRGATVLRLDLHSTLPEETARGI